MSNRLLSLTFDPQTFAIPPNFDKWVVAETSDRIILSASSSEGKRENFEIKFNGARTANVIGLPEGDYTLYACLPPGDKYQICFTFHRQGGIEEIDRINFDERAYVEAFLQASKALSLKPSFNSYEFERQFGISYLMSQLGHRIEGTFEFWRMLEEDIDMVTTPMNHAMIRENGKFPEKPYYVSLNNGPLVKI